MGAVVTFAVDVSHDFDGLSFAFHSFVFGVWRLWFHVNRLNRVEGVVGT